MMISKGLTRIRYSQALVFEYLIASYILFGKYTQDVYDKINEKMKRYRMELIRKSFESEIDASNIVLNSWLESFKNG